MYIKPQNRVFAPCAFEPSNLCLKFILRLLSPRLLLRLALNLLLPSTWSLRRFGHWLSLVLGGWQRRPLIPGQVSLLLLLIVRVNRVQHRL